MWRAAVGTDIANYWAPGPRSVVGFRTVLVLFESSFGVQCWMTLSRMKESRHSHRLIVKLVDMRRRGHETLIALQFVCAR